MKSSQFSRCHFPFFSIEFATPINYTIFLPAPSGSRLDERRTIPFVRLMFPLLVKFSAASNRIHVFRSIFVRVKLCKFFTKSKRLNYQLNYTRFPCQTQTICIIRFIRLSYEFRTAIIFFPGSHLLLS